MKRVSDLCHHITSSFGLKSGVYLTLEDYTLPPCENLKNVIFPQDVIQVHSTSKQITSCKREREESILNTSSSSSDGSSDNSQLQKQPLSMVNQHKEQRIKRPFQILKQISQQEDGNSTDSNTYVNLLDIEQIDASKHIIASSYQGTRLKLDQQNKQDNQENTQGKQGVIQINIKSPAQEFAAKKAQWKIKPFGKRKNNMQQKKRKLNEQGNIMNKKEEIQNESSGFAQVAQQEILQFKPEIGQQILVKVNEISQNDQSIQNLQLKKGEIKQVQEQLIVVVFEADMQQNETKIQLNDIQELWLRKKEENQKLQQIQTLKEPESQPESITQQNIQMLCQETESQINQQEKSNFEYQTQAIDSQNQIKSIQQANDKSEIPVAAVNQQINAEIQQAQVQEQPNVIVFENENATSNAQKDIENNSQDKHDNSTIIAQQDNSAVIAQQDNSAVIAQQDPK